MLLVLLLAVLLVIVLGSGFGLLFGLSGLFGLGLLGLLLYLLLGLLLLNRLLCAVQVLGQVGHAVVLAEFLQQVVQLVLLQSGAVLLAGAAHGGQLIEDLLCRNIQILCKIAYFIFYGHSLISSSFLIAPQSERRSKQSFARLRSVTA